MVQKHRLKEKSARKEHGTSAVALGNVAGHTPSDPKLDGQEMNSA